MVEIAKALQRPASCKEVFLLQNEFFQIPKLGVLNKTSYIVYDVYLVLSNQTRDGFSGTPHL